MLLAAADFLGRRPNATYDEIAKAAGVSRATLHRYFPRREDLLKALVRNAAKKMKEALITADLDKGDCTSAVRRLVAASVEHAPYLALLYTLSQDDLPASEYPIWEQIDQAVTELFERGQSSGEFTTRLTAPWMAEALFSLVAGAVWAVRSGRCAQRDFAHMVTQMVLSGAGNQREST
ncbi:TetR/AcrR family transcriptional regulator [Crossiella sp. SN42]|uniref:TetR/AcrR family transcriptional regulator n=1 Tax=Crossiella sp. SN42 TaxID=2944808 RepID=UPI00207D00BE|nr:TetR/AcrR family transcriptional regulator [Crossiella sp. SN42]MCO1580518.1 TetR/AcrR family transcriptional regulator [Crossiella sp. SN42]